MSLASVDLEADGVANKPQTDTPLLPSNTTETKSLWTKKNVLIGSVILTIVLIVIIIIIIIEISSSGTSSSPLQSPDMLYIYHSGGRIYTMDPDPEFDNENNTINSICINIRNGKFVFIGDNSTEILNKCIEEKENNNYNILKKLYFNGSITENITILPGLTDSHAHIMSLGSNYFRADLSTATSIQQILNIIDNFISNYSISETDWVQAWGWDQGLWNDNPDLINGLPTRWMLDDRFPTNKLYLKRIDGHASWVNTAALNDVPLLPDVNMSDGEIIRDEYGNITGALVDSAMYFVLDYIPDPSENEQYEMLEKVLQECSKNGLTGVHDAGVDPNTINLYKNVIDNPNKYGFEFTLRVNAFASSGLHPDDYVKYNLYKDKLTVGTVKFMMDGALGSRGAALVKPYCDLNTTSGLLFWPDEGTFYDNISLWHDNGFQIACHAIGDAANREVIDQFIALIQNNGLEDHRLRIEHAQIVNATRDIPLIGIWGIIPSMQPTHATSDMSFAQDRLCVDRLTGAYAWAAMLDANVPSLPFGSDFPAVGVVNPFLGIYAAITRKNESGLPINGWTNYSKVSKYQAIKGYTYDAAFAAFQENITGTINENKYADFIIIDRDILNIDDENIDDILSTNVIATYLGGKQVYISPDWIDIIDW